MWISHRPERGVTHRSGVHFQPGALPEFPNIVEAQTHDEIMRMLTIHDGLPERGFAGLEKKWIAAIGGRGRLQAQHEIRLECTVLTGAMLHVSHEQIR